LKGTQILLPVLPFRQMARKLLHRVEIELSEYGIFKPDNKLAKLLKLMLLCKQSHFLLMEQELYLDQEINKLEL